ncbi:MAG: hydrogenase maturation nickel metallochaperone HypA [Phycisphaerales bacterium JB038]
MHEMSIASALLEQVELSLPQEGRLVEVRIAVGALEHLDSEVLRLAWESLVMQRPRLAGSRLEVNHVSLRIRCRKCGHVHEPEDIYGMLCPLCASAQPEILQGSGIVLTGLSVDQGIAAGKE